MAAPAKSLEVAVTSNQTVTTVTLAGTVRAPEAAQLQQRMSEVLADAPQKVIINCQSLEYIGASGVNALVKFMQEAQQTIVRLVNVTPNVRSIFGLIELEHLVKATCH